ncbi:LysR family transcriptional regulator [Amycolatopsis jejuensis]|uniref:LysR family transcriptional regulator n=1 Tax=Amycolatopsis jejuensis TaxID=330084 RepID=UPI000523FDE6|nr:LysR family transcriptional regulator [Amycolatopsis jejuensis]
MELRHLEVFVTVAREQNVTKAAAVLDLTPSPVSRTVRELERELGKVLFERRYHELVMTRAAEEILPTALEMLRLAGVVRDEEPKPLRLGSTPWAAQRFADRLRRAAAEVQTQFEIDEAMSSELIRRLQFGELDLALVHLPLDVPGIKCRVVAEYRHYLAGYPLPDRNRQDRPVLVLPAVLNADATERMVRHLTEAGHRRVGQIEFAELVTVQSRLRRTGELLVIPKAKDTATGALLDLDELEFTELDDHGERMQLGVAWRATDASKTGCLTTLADTLAPPGRAPAVV